MLTVEEKNFLDHYKNASYHRVYEMERFANLWQKLDKWLPQADKL